jgi:peptidoglycan/xylan/chitin deacetylase (PgdA/CDA1 family)
MQRATKPWAINGAIVVVVAVVALILAVMAPPAESASSAPAAVAEDPAPDSYDPPGDAERDIYALGDTELISDQVLDHLASCAGGSVVRLAGREPYELVAEVSASRFESADVVYVTAAQGSDVSAVVAASAVAPVLLVERDALPAATIAELRRLAPSEIVVRGDTAVVGESVATALGAFAERVGRVSEPGPVTTTVGVIREPVIVRASVLIVSDAPSLAPFIAAILGADADTPVIGVDRDAVPPAAAEAISRLTGTPCAPFEVACEAGWIALTYDDGPNPDRTNVVLAALEQADVKATFFMVGYLAEAYPATVQQISSAGHAIANHSNEHEILTKLSDAAIAETLNAADAKIRAAGVEPIGLVRPPGGATDARVKNVIEQVGDRRQILWTVDPRDWDDNSAMAIADHVIAHAEDGSVVLMHDALKNYHNTVDATETIVWALKQQGYCFGVLDGSGNIIP